ncbi:MAG TPA: PAS domain S-box protein [Chthoniobacterales bacterium]|nr:PAS domain S-box protein [Chthoniobacterales bacterium]
MEPNDDTEQLLRSSALQTASSILQVRQRAEQELIQAKQALELKTKELAHSLSMMQATLESTSNGILVTDGCGKITAFNEKYVEMWRIPREILDAREEGPVREIAGQQLNDPGAFIARIREIEASGLAESYDVLEFRDGRIFERYSKLQTIENQSVGRVWSFSDVTERNQAEIISQRLAAIVDSSDDAIVGKDLNSIVTSWNAGAERIFGYSASEMIGTSIMRLIPPDHQAEEDQILSCIRRGQRVDPIETVRVGKDGRLLNVSITVSPIKDSSGNVIGASKVGRDITERKRAEERLQVAKIAAERANQAKDDFLAVLSHELRTPLTPALAAASYLAEHEELPPHLREEVTAIRRNVQFEARLIDDLLDLTRITRGKLELHPETVDAHRLLQNALTIVHEDVVRKELDVVTDLGAPDHHISADPIRIQQVFWNLLNNAVKFTPQGGRVTIRTSNDAGRFVFEITDTGIGIESEHQSRIFHAFEQGEVSIIRQFGGLGLGLTISQTLLQLHGGTISVQSDGKNRGASFKVTLDALHEPLVAPPQVTNGDFAIARGLRLLLVDDHADTRRILSRLLGKCGHEVSTADSGQSALKLMETERFDALISDIGLPDSSGYELVREAKRRQPVQGIALSGFGMEEDVRRSLEAGFDYHLTKPVEFQDLKSLLQKIAS